MSATITETRQVKGQVELAGPASPTAQATPAPARNLPAAHVTAMISKIFLCT